MDAKKIMASLLRAAFTLRRYALASMLGSAQITGRDRSFSRDHDLSDDKAAARRPSDIHAVDAAERCARGVHGLRLDWERSRSARPAKKDKPLRYAGLQGRQ
jgi:hypothetical protein